MDPLTTALLNYGALGILLAILVIAVKTLYSRNTTLNDRLHQIVKENTEAFHRQATATEGLTEVIKSCVHRRD